MQKQAPTLGRILVMAGFALSCFGLLLYLWVSFGGYVPLKPKGYQFHVYFPEAQQLAQQADVRISGVPVGKVVKLQLGPNDTTDATLQLDARYAPIPKDARAILRQKTLLGETYVELTPGDKSDGTLPEGGHLPASAVGRTVELDEIFRALDERTRDAFQVWMQSTAEGLKGRGPDFNDALGNLPAFADDTNTLLDVLNRQEPMVQQLIRNTGVVFDAFSRSSSALQGLIHNSNTVFQTVADRNDALEATFKALPTFEREAQLTQKRFNEFARDTNPLIDQLKPAAQQLSPTLQSLARLAPPFRDFFVDLGPLITASYRGFPAFSRFLDDLRPVLGQLDPFTRTLNPVLAFLGSNLRELDAFFGNFAAASNTFTGRTKVLRGLAPFIPQGLATYPQRLAYDRTNPYRAPNTSGELQQGLSNFETRQCSNGLRPTPQFPADFAAIVGGLSPYAAAQISQLAYRVFRDAAGNIVSGSYTDVPAPGCRAQGRYPGFDTGAYPHVTADPPAKP